LSKFSVHFLPLTDWAVAVAVSSRQIWQADDIHFTQIIRDYPRESAANMFYELADNYISLTCSN
jgi:hypothetical protein